MRIEVCPNYTPHPEQRKVHASGARWLAAAAGARGGKTRGMGAEFVRRIALDLQAGRGNIVAGIGKRRRPRLHYWVVSPISDLLKEPIRTVLEMVPSEWADCWYESEKALWLKGDVLIEFKTADNPLHLVSVGLNGMWLDESARIKADAWRGQLRQRLSDKQGWGLFSTTPLGRNWFYEDIVTKSGTADFKTVSWTTAQNTALPGIAAEVESQRLTMPKRYFEREYLASFDAFTGNVFDEFSGDHVITEAAFRLEMGINGHPLKSLFRRVVAGVDWGWNSPSAIVVVGDLGGRWVVLEESYGANRLTFDPRYTEGTLATEAARLREKYGVTQFFADPSQPAAIHDFIRAGLPCIGADNAIDIGIRKMAEALHPVDGKPRLRVLAGCENLIRELRAYQWAPNKAGDAFTDLPADGQSDHAIDACRYAMADLMRFEKPGAQRVQRYRPMASGGPVY